MANSNSRRQRFPNQATSTRRGFLKTSAVIGAGFWIGGSVRAEEDRNSPNEKVRLACIGLGAMGTNDASGVAKLGDIVALCEVDDKRLAKHGEKWTKAKRYTDYRKLLEEMAPSIDGVTVSTPDHMHAPIAAMAMKLGKAVYVQKPLANTIYETRRLAEIARETKVATQMGNQGTAETALRKSAAMLQAGCVGEVKELHVWSDRPAKIWVQGIERPQPSDPPATLHWDAWLGPAPKRPYAKGYHPSKWRGYWDFGAGALGDMGCHGLNMPFMGLDLRNPSSIVAEASDNTRETYPQWSIITYEFPATDKRPAVKLTWYDGGKLPPKELFEGRDINAGGSLIVGDKGKMYHTNDYGSGDPQLFGGAEKKEVTIVESPGHYQEWVSAIRGGPTPVSNFPDYAGPLTEIVLAGNLALWTPGKKIEWDAKNMQATNAPELAERIRKVYQNGYTPI